MIISEPVGENPDSGADQHSVELESFLHWQLHPTQQRPQGASSLLDGSMTDAALRNGTMFARRNGLVSDDRGRSLSLKYRSNS